MNFLAHLFLSGDDDLIKIGNFMADGIKGNHFENYLPKIKKGIILHRSIDTFTDAHPLFRQSTKRLHPQYHHYSGVIVDIFYDHFLAKNWSNYSNEKLDNYVARFYQSLKDNYTNLSPKTQSIMPYMVDQNWLVSYRTVDGIENILLQMDKRINRESNMASSVKELRLNYSNFEKEFTAFFEEVSNFSKQYLEQL